MLGPTIEILTNAPVDGAGIEAPSLFFDVGSSLYVLMFNAGCFVKSGYRIEYATSADVAGPYTRRGYWSRQGARRGIFSCPEGLMF